MRGARRRSHSTHQWGINRQFSIWLVGDSRKSHVTKLRNAGPARKERFEKEPGWHRSNNLPFYFTSETFVLATRNIGRDVDVMPMNARRGIGERGGGVIVAEAGERDEWRDKARRGAQGPRIREPAVTRSSLLPSEP